MKEIDGIVGEIAKVSYWHTYKLSGFMDKKGRHDCLRSGYWCWRNLLEHPLDLVKYLKVRKEK